MLKLKNIINIINQKLTLLLQIIAVTFFSTATCLYTLQLLLRTIFNQSITGIDPLINYLFALSALIGAALACQTNENIKIEILNNHSIGAFLKPYLNIFAFLITIFVLFIFSQHLLFELNRNEATFLNLKKWILDIPYLIIFITSSFYYLNLFLNNFPKNKSK